MDATEAVGLKKVALFSYHDGVCVVSVCFGCTEIKGVFWMALR